MSDCRCNGTGWVKARVPQMYQHEYDGRTFGWAGCNVEEHRLNADEDPPDDDTQPDPSPYGWEPMEAS